MTTSEAEPKHSGFIVKPMWARAALNIVAWTGFGIFMGAQSYYLLLRTGHPVPWGTTLFRELVYAYLWAALTPLVLSFARTFPLDGKNWPGRFLFHLGASFAIAVLHKVLYHIIVMLAEAIPGRTFTFERLFLEMWTYLDYGILLYWLLLIIHHAAGFYQRFKEKEVQASHLETQLTRAQLEALKMQLQPHFLFNTLNAISVLISNNPDSARRMISKLADLLRITLESGGKQEVPLEQELVFLESYLEIEQTRFEDRLNVRLHIAPETLSAMVPSLLLQPIVENAMRHGVAERRGSTFVEVRTEQQNGSLKLQVRDNGPGINRQYAHKEGIGFSNTRERLRQLYGSRFSFDVVNAPEGGALATIIIPFHAQTAAVPTTED